MRRDLYELSGAEENELRERWLVAVEAIVAENVDPEHQDRIKVIVPVIDEDRVLDKWVRPLVRFSGPAGFGDSHRPAVGSEVILIGRQGEKHNLFYVSVSNEEHLIPEELRAQDVRGFKTDRDYKAIIGGDYEIVVDGDLLIDCQGEVTINADRLTVNAPEGLHVNGAGVFVNGIQLNVP